MRRYYKYSLLFLLLVLCVLVFFILMNGFLAYLDWNSNKDRLISNLKEYYLKLKNDTSNNPYIVLDDEGKVIEIEPTRILDRNDKVIGEFSPSKREIVQLNDIPYHLVRSLILIEDSGFYSHHGVNVKGILRALVKNALHFRIMEGGSTITQQLAKLLFTSRQQNIYRKFLELYGALAIEKQFSKKDILLMYLNTVYFGHGVYGVQAAAKLYFNKNLRNLNQFEMAMLISLLPAPNYYSPFNNIKAAMWKHKVVLNKLREFRLISSSDLDKRYAEFWSDYRKKLAAPHISYWKMNVNNAPYVVEAIRQYLEKRYSVSQILQGNLKVSTTVDLDVQNILQDEVNDYYKSLSAVFTNEEDYRNIQMAGIVMKPDDGSILGFVGGTSFTFMNQLNRAFYIKRQVGSSIKPFLYAAGINEKLFTLTTIMTDRLMTFRDKNRNYVPKNHDLRYRGEVFYREGLIRSINTVSVQILNKLTPEVFIHEYLNRIYYGLEQEADFLPVLSLALGAVEMSPFELCTAYCTLANGGNKIYPILVNDIKNASDETSLNNERLRNETLTNWQKDNLMKVYSQGTCYIISDTLKNVFSKEGTAYTAEKYPLHITISGKTGTTSNNKDAWCVGYTQDYVLTLWMGFDDYQKETSRIISGGLLVAPLVIKIFNKLYWNKDYQDYTVPSDEITFCNVNKATGRLAQANSTNILYRVPYLNNTGPKEY